MFPFKSKEEKKGRKHNIGFDSNYSRSMCLTMTVNEADECSTGMPVERIRHLAAATGELEEIMFNSDSRAISFRRKDGSGARINVYYTTGTVGTALEHPKSGKTQLFRRNVDITELLEIFLNPRVHTGAGYYQRKQQELAMHRAKEEAERKAAQEAEMRRADEESRRKAAEELKRKAEEEEAKRKAAEAEARKKAEEEEKKRKEEDAAREKVEEKRLWLRGRGWRRAAMSMDGFSERCNPHVKAVAAHDGYFFIYDSNKLGYWNVPPGLHGLMKKRTRDHPAPDVVALGPKNRYFIQFTDGSFCWRMDDSRFCQTIEEEMSAIRLVAIGGSSSSWVVVSASRCYWGHGTPSGLVQYLKSREPSAIEMVTMGANGEYFVRFREIAYVSYGTKRWVWKDLEDALESITVHRMRVNRDQPIIREVIFGAPGCWAVRHIEL